MLWVRLKTEVKDRLGPRAMEWEHSILLMVFGYFLGQPSYNMWTIPSEDVWGTIIFLLGFLRFSGLVVNGLRRRVTSWLRAVSAVLSSMVFMLIGIGYLYSGGSSAVAWFMPVVALFELFNFARAMRDVGSAS